MAVVGWAVPVAKAFLAALLAVLLLFQTFSLPGQFAHMAQEDPDQAYLRWPMTAISVFLVLCVQIVVVATWRLLTLVRDDRIFTARSLVWVDAIIGAVVAGWSVFFGLFLYVGVQATDPGLPLLMFLLLVGGAVLGLLIVVMRELLRQATTLRDDMDAVI
ncbi:hypothetical protein ASG82_10400 [Mycobacterium sp. Soil538]|nr:hypothetical protein ASG82_10400 [Mycobacterium sp. Soil538]